MYGILARILGCDADYLHNEGDDFIAMAGQEYGYRGKKGAERLLKEIRGAFSGGEMAEEDMDELMLAIQEAYIDAKKRNKKYTPKNISSRTMQSKSAVSDFISVKLKLYHSARKG